MRHKNFPRHMILTLATILAGSMANCALGQVGDNAGQAPKPTQTAVRSDAAEAPTSYYIDSIEGQNTNSGTSPESPWRDFANINGKTLNAGEKLLIKRGSVINQELQVSARGTADNWAEIGAYGTGARPVIRRNWDIRDRCVLVRNPDFLRIRSLVVCYAGKGLVVYYATLGHAGLVIEDCVAHHIEGIYRERTNCSGIPEWRNYEAPADDGFRASAGIAVTGSGRNITIRDCDIFQTSWGFWVRGEQVTLDRIHVHHCYIFNGSPHPALTGIRNSVMQNCIFDVSGWHAYAGTMGIMLGSPQGLIIRNCIFRNQPDSGSHDEGGIDFEARGNGCLIDNCTFENNAGAPIEVLGLRSPQIKNVEISNSRFIKNNWAKKLGPSEIYIWGNRPDPKVCCSTGTVHNNGYVLLPGVKFFVNEAPTTTSWTLQDNTQYACAEDLERAMPYNKPPVVEAGPGICTHRLAVPLTGSVTDDGKPAGSRLSVKWEVLEGPGTVAFENAGAPKTTANFSTPGDYLLRLVGDDGELWLSDMVTVHILPLGVSVARVWDFDTPLDKEGWIETDLGTRERVEQPIAKQTGKSLPVKYVAGGYYIVAVENSTNAHLLSANDLGVDVSVHKTIKVRFQNHTPATRMRFAFTTAADTAWDQRKSKSFDVIANDNGPREYAVDMSSLSGWTGSLQRLRVNLASEGTAVTGTCRIDYIWIDSSKPLTP